MADSTPTPTEVTPPKTGRAQAALRGLRWLGIWLPGAAVALLLAGGLGFWLWAGTAGSLATTLGWAQSWMQGRSDRLGQLTTEGVEGSLRGGGRIASLGWTQGKLNVKAEGAQIVWTDALWSNALLGRGIHIAALSLQQLSVDDQRAPSPTEPMATLVLPLPVSLAIKVDHFDLRGNTRLTLSNIQADYQYGALTTGQEGPALPASPGLANAHRLRLDSLQLADGRYEGNLALGAEAPMPLALALVGNIQTRVPNGAGVLLTVHGQAHGTLAGAQATIDLDAEAQGTSDLPNAQATTLNLKARVTPWAQQPLLSATANAQSLNLASLWPGAPESDLSGQLLAQPEGETWRAQVQLDNALIGPADKNGLPLKSLRAAVEQNGDRWTISDLQAQLGGGALQGQASFSLNSQGEAVAFGQWQGDIQGTDIRPALLWSELAQGALDGKLSARAAPNPQAAHAIAVNASVKPSAQQPRGAALTGLRLTDAHMQGQWQPTTPTGTRGTLDLKQAHIAMANAQFDTHGQFDTARMSYDGYLSLRLPGARLDAKGLLAHAQGQGQADLQLQDAARLLTWVRSLQKLPFVGPKVAAALAGQDQLALKGSGDAQLQWSGGLGALGYPAALDQKASANPEAPPSLPQIQAALNVPGLQVQTDAEAKPTVIEDLALKAGGPMSSMQLSATGSLVASPWRVSLDAAGRLRASAKPNEGGTLTLNQIALQLAPLPKKGEKTTTESWQIQSGKPLLLNWKTTDGKGLALDAGTGELQLQPLSDRASRLGAPLTVAWQRALWQANALETQGRLQGLTLPWIEALAAIGQSNSPLFESNGIVGDLVMDGAWNVRIPADTVTPVDISATLQRRTGDLQWRSLGSPASGAGAVADAIAAGVKDARISLVVKDRQAQALLRWDSERLGQVSADASTQLSGAHSKTAGSLLDRMWPDNTPIRGSAKARLPEVGVWSMFAPPGWRMRGTLTADASLTGTRGAPEFRGALQADELALRSVVDGFAFTNGQLRATLEGDRISVDRFSLQGPGGAQAGGTLEASGQAEWRVVEGSLLRQPFVDLKAKAQRLRVSTRVDRRLTLSGDATAQLAGPKLLLRGQLTADSALFILPNELAPSLSKDVVVRSTRTAPTEEDGAQRVQPDISVSLDLGKQFEVRGQGIDTRLEGQITVRATPALPTPRALGEVRAVSGTYKAYGQQLNIETGVLRFTGPYDDPALDILAVRKLPDNTDQRVGVKITGNAQAPRVGLFAEPDLPDGDKLAWLVLGRPASAAGAQAFVLQQAARKLLSRGGEPVDSALAKNLGLDEIGFSGPSTSADGTTTQAALTLGKRLSDDIYLSYEQSLAGTMSAVSILYDLSKSFTLRARAGTENAVDLIFTHRYE